LHTKTLFVFVVVILFGCSKTYDSKLKRAWSEYRYWCSESNLKEDLFTGPILDTSYLSRAYSFKWNYFEQGFKDTLSVVVAIEQERFGLSAGVYQEGAVSDWRRIVKSKYNEK
jgi:hypothetical protein